MRLGMMYDTVRFLDLPVYPYREVSANDCDRSLQTSQIADNFFIEQRFNRRFPGLNKNESHLFFL
jgi:hypothetical protein